MADVEDAEAAQTIYIFAAGDVLIGIWSRIGPLDDGAGALRVRRLAILEEAGVDVIAKPIDRLARDLLSLVGRDLALRDQV